MDEHESEDFSPRLAILGAGPIGLEAALYARFLGLEVAVFEKHEVAHHVRQWGHVKMFSPFGMNSSPLGRAALSAQSETSELPSPDAMLLGSEFAEQYLIPLSTSDLLSGCIHTGVEVVSVGRDGVLKSDGSADEREECLFAVLVRSADGEDIVHVDVVIDTTGVFGSPNSMGHGGIPAPGERACANEIEYGVPDVLGAERSRYVDGHTLVVGSGYSAATNVVQLAELNGQNTGTRVTWVTRRECADDGPIPLVPNDRLPNRNELAQQANALVSQGSCVEHHDQTVVLGVAHDPDTGRYEVTFGGRRVGTEQFDQIIANVGFRPQLSLFSELQVAVSSRNEAIEPLAGWLHQQGRIDAVDQASPGAEILQTSEPDFYVLGSKSFGRNSNFLLAFGLEQIRDIFTVIADREDLDLYKTMAGQ